MLEQFRKMIQEIESIGEEFEFFGKVTEYEIEKAEIRLGVKFPDDYKEFLKNWGGGGIVGGSKISGLVPGEPDIESFGTIIGDTLEARNRFNIDPKFLIIHSNEEEVYWAIDCSQSKEVSLIVGIDVLHDRKVTKIADSLSELLTNYFSVWLE